jgi:hypothetical protein
MAEPTLGTAYRFFISLVDSINSTQFKANPTISVGDFKISIAGGALQNLATLPSVVPAGSKIVQLDLSAAEMAAPDPVVVASDPDGEWNDSVIPIHMTAPSTVIVAPDSGSGSGGGGPISFAASAVDVVNESLGLVGKDPITDLEDTADPVAIKSSMYFGSLLRSLLRSHTWNFAIDRVDLAENATAPISGFSHSFALPVNCFRVLGVNEGPRDEPSGVAWKLEGRNLLTDEATARIRFVKWQSDPNYWDGSFYQAFVSLLGARLATAFNSDSNKAVELLRLYQLQIMDAMAIDGQESSVETMSCTALTDDIREF